MSAAVKFLRALVVVFSVLLLVSGSGLILLCVMGISEVHGEMMGGAFDFPLTGFALALAGAGGLVHHFHSTNSPTRCEPVIARQEASAKGAVAMLGGVMVLGAVYFHDALDLLGPAAILAIPLMGTGLCHLHASCHEP